MGNDALEEEARAASAADFIAVEQSEQFKTLKRRHRSFVLPVTAAAVVWYLAYVVLAGWAHDFMATPVFGNVNVGLLIGLGQFLTTFLITGIYVRFANRELDPRAAAIRAEMAGTER